MRGLASGLIIALVSVCISTAQASTTGSKDMGNRLGVGYSDSLAVKFYPSNDWALSAALGIDTNTTNATGNSIFGIGAKFYKTIFTESMLNFFLGAGVGLISSGPASGVTGGSTSSGFDLDAFGGCEFFFPGLDNLGFNFMFGVGVTSISSGVRFRTIGDSPLTGGIYFYF